MSARVQFLSGPDGRPAYAVLPIEDYLALLGDGPVAGDGPLHRPRPVAPVPAPFELPAEIARRVADGVHPIQAWREAKDLPREVLGGWIGFEEADVEAFETGELVPTVEICQMIANALDVPLAAILPPGWHDG